MVDTRLDEIYKDVIEVNKKKLVQQLTCSLCTGIFRTPMTINECMHTFCKTCIYKYFLSNSNYDSCPSCFTKLGGKPLETLIFDNSISALVDILFPEFDELDKEACVK